MNLVSLERVAKAYGQRTLLEGVSTGVAAGDRIGVVGVNGAGKSTLLALLSGAQPPDQGRVARARGLRAGHLAQRDQLAGTVAELVWGDRPEHVWAGDPRARAVAGGLLAGIDAAAAASRLSGGERRRVALAALLTREHDLLLLDEPTNQLDLEAIAWLGEFLPTLPSALVVVTHDRWFLDAVTTRTWELAGGRLHGYDGGYAAYVLARAERARAADASERRRQNLLRKELAWLRRGPPARTTKPKFRIDAANALIAREPPARDQVALARSAVARLGKTVIETEKLGVRAGDRALLDGVTWSLGPGERVGLLGANGSGKTSLLRVLSGVAVGDGPWEMTEPALRTPAPSSPTPPLSAGARSGLDDGLTIVGKVKRGGSVRLAYFEQDDEGLDLSLNAREYVAGAGNLLADYGAGSAGGLLERVGVRGDSQFVPLGELSGGERRRVRLVAALAGEPNVMLLDEPTNDLDVDTLTELEDMLDAWPGSLVVVSHDRYFLERVTDHVVALLGDGNLAYLGGGVTEYLERRSGGAAGLAAVREPGTRGAGGRAGWAPDSPGEPGPAGAAKPKSDGVKPKSDGARRRDADKELRRLERRIETLQGTEAELHESLAAHASDYVTLTELGERLRAVVAERGELEERWLELAEDSAR